MSELERMREIISRIDRLESDFAELKRFWSSSVDDIKNLIRVELSDLKTEQIGDLKQAIKDRDSQVSSLEMRLRLTEDALRDWNAHRGFVRWVITTLTAAAAACSGYFGAKHWG